MSLLRRLARVTALAANRVAERLLTWAGETPVAGAEPDIVDAAAVEPDEGPPAHWLETVRSKAPWLLTGGRWPRPESPVRRLPVTQPTPKQKPAPSRLQGPGHGVPNVVYKEGDRPNATRKREDRSLSEPVRSPPAADRMAPAAPGPGPSAKERQGGDASSRGVSEAGPSPSPGTREPRGLASRRSSALSAPPVLPSSTAPVMSVQPGASIFSPLEPEARRPPATAPIRPAPPPSGARSVESVESVPSRLGGPRSTEPPAVSHDRRPAPRFFPTILSGPAREYPKTQADGVEEEATVSDDLWPQLPEWGWQQWQVDPIQRQLQEWNRRGRLTAEQAGSSWSGRLF
jgi:hypothetical protein